MSQPFKIRRATFSEVPELTEMIWPSFATCNGRGFIDAVFPRTDDASYVYFANQMNTRLVTENVHVMVAEEQSHGGSVPGAKRQKRRLAGWASWTRQPEAPEPPPPRRVFTRDMYPAGGDPDFGVQFYQESSEKAASVIQGRPCWILQSMVIHPDFQRKGAGSLLTAFGIEKADDEEMICYTAATDSGKGLYEKFGFECVGATEMRDREVTVYHMRRPGRRG